MRVDVKWLPARWCPEALPRPAQARLILDVVLLAEVVADLDQHRDAILGILTLDAFRSWLDRDPWLESHGAPAS